MLEYFAYKKVKKHKAGKAVKEEDAKKNRKKAEVSRLSDAGPRPVESADAPPASRHHNRSRSRDAESGLDQTVIRPGDENFLEELVASDDVPAPPLPPRLYSRDLDWNSDRDDVSVGPSTQDATTEDVEGKDKQTKRQGRLSALFTRRKHPPDSLAPAERDREKRDLSRVLDRLNLSVASNNKVISTDSSAAITSFTNVFKDLVNGVPTAYDDLMRIIDDRDGALARGFDKLPASLKKLVTQLPDKVASSLGPEILAAAAASQGIKADTAGGLKGAAKSVFVPTNLAQLVTKPGAIVSMLRAIVGVLKTRWPAFIGMNVIWGVAMSLLLFVLWYCHKRGREVRLEGERSVDGSDRIEELPDDLTLPAPEGPSRVTVVEEACTQKQKGKVRTGAR